MPQALYRCYLACCVMQIDPILQMRRLKPGIAFSSPVNWVVALDFTPINLKMCVFLDYFVIKYRTFDQSWALPDVILFLEDSTPPSQHLWVDGQLPQHHSQLLPAILCPACQHQHLWPVGMWTHHSQSWT